MLWVLADFFDCACLAPLVTEVVYCLHIQTNFMKKIVFILLAISACSAPADREDIQNDLPPIQTIFESYSNERLAFNPLEATALGIKKYNDTIPIFISDSYQSKAAAFYRRYLDTLRLYPSGNLKGNNRLFRNVMEWECQIRLEGLKNSPSLVTTPMFGMPAIDVTPVNQIMSFHLYMAQLAGGAGVIEFRTTEDYYDWLSRLDDYAAWLDTAILKMKEGMESNFTLPSVIVHRVIDQLQPFIESDIRNHVFYRPILNLSDDLPPIEHEVLPSKYEAVILNKLIPAYERLSDFLEKEYLPAATESSGIGQLPNGMETYKYLVRYHTTTDMTPDEIFNLGQQEVERISREMEKVMDEVGFNGSLREFFDYVRSNPALMPYSTPEQIIAHFNEIHERMKPNLERLFNKTPKGSFEVRRTESFREASASAEYNVGSKDGSRPGIFYVPLPDPSAYNIFSDESLFLHEAIPGHHYQLSLQQENNDIPTFLHSEGLGVFVEGWALYAESLGSELGLYEDPYQYFGMLSAEMHRAIRLVVDVGIHAKGWSREEAIRYSLDHEAESEASVTAEIERYMVAPGQALSYKIGQLKILELRSRAKAALGDSFDIREFHDQVLGTGSLPLVLLEEKINTWIKTKE